jgi:hypothetical protein
MSTRSTISLQLDNDEYKTIYCHSDGYLTHNGAMLLDHYNTKEKVEELLNLGDLSCLGPKVNPDPSKPHSFEFEQRQFDVCVAYGRDRGESNTQSKILTLKEMFNETWIEYFYIFTKDGKWKYYDYTNTKNVKDVSEDLENKYKEMGFKRPKGFYGFWTKQSINEYKSSLSKKQKSNDELE